MQSGCDEVNSVSFEDLVPGGSVSGSIDGGFVPQTDGWTLRAISVSSNTQDAWFCEMVL